MVTSYHEMYMFSFRKRYIVVWHQELMSAAKRHKGASNCHTFVVPSSVEFSTSKIRLIR